MQFKTWNRVLFFKPACPDFLSFGHEVSIWFTTYFMIFLWCFGACKGQSVICQWLLIIGKAHWMFTQHILSAFMLCFPATGQVRNTCMYVAGGEDDMYVKSVEYAVRNPACCANTFDYTRTIDLTSASTVTLPSKPKVCCTTDECLSILY